MMTFTCRSTFLYEITKELKFNLPVLPLPFQGGNLLQSLRIDVLLHALRFLAAGHLAAAAATTLRPVRMETTWPLLRFLLTHRGRHSLMCSSCWQHRGSAGCGVALTQVLLLLVKTHVGEKRRLLVKDHRTQEAIELLLLLLLQLLMLLPQERGKRRRILIMMSRRELMLGTGNRLADKGHILMRVQDETRVRIVRLMVVRQRGGAGWHPRGIQTASMSRMWVSLAASWGGLRGRRGRCCCVLLRLVGLLLLLQLLERRVADVQVQQVVQAAVENPAIIVLLLLLLLLPCL